MLTYRDARAAYETEVENASLGYDTEAAEYRASVPGVTFRQWLEGMRQEKYDVREEDGVAEGEG